MADQEILIDRPVFKIMGFLKYMVYWIASGILLIIVTLSIDPNRMDTMHAIADYIPGLHQYMIEFHSTKASVKSERHNWINGPSKDPKLRILSDDDIKFEEDGKLLLVVVGHVFDVSSATSMYKPSSGYFGFIGRDSSRAFVSGDFTEAGLIDDLSGLEPQDYIGLADWITFYLTHDKYKFVGYHVGSFFDKFGKETEQMAEFRNQFDNAQKEAEKDGDLKKVFPSCNVEWTQEKGSVVWCSKLSGGIDREWVGFPRRFFEKPDKSPRCACVHPNYLADPRVELYDGCAINDEQCNIKPEPEEDKAEK